jgi:hypothetical protein
MYGIIISIFYNLNLYPILKTLNICKYLKESNKNITKEIISYLSNENKGINTQMGGPQEDANHTSDR